MLPLHAISDINYTVNANFNHCGTSGAWSCTHDFRPSWNGDCKNVAALKLRELILAGAGPHEFTIWVVKVPDGLHAVLVQNSTGLVLDNMINIVEHRNIKERFESMEFKGPCDICGDMARKSAALELKREGK